MEKLIDTSKNGKYLVYDTVESGRYIVYPDGQVYDTKKEEFKHQTIRKVRDHHGGYYEGGYRTVSLRSTRNGLTRSRSFSVHRLVATMFIPNPKNLPMVNHIDGVKHNNHVENLEWCNAFENNCHAICTGLRPIGEDSANAKYTNDQVRRACELLEKGELRSVDIAEIVGIPPEIINSIKCGSSWTHISKNYKFITQQRISEDLARKLCEYLELGFKCGEIADMFDVTKKTVVNIRDGNTWKEISTEYDFSKQPHHLTEDEVHTICQNLSDGVSVNKISEMTGISTNKIYKIKNRTTWVEISSLYEF